MYQIDQATASSTLPAPAAAGTQGFFTNGNPASGVAATIVDADWLNMIQQELVNIVAAAGITPSKTTYNQVLSAIKRIGQSTVVLTDTGAVNAYSATNAVPLVAGTWINGVVQQIVVAHTNNGASTYAPDGLSPIPIYGLGLQPLQQGEMFAGGTAILMKQTIAGVNGGNPICVLLECAGGAQQIPPATASQHAVQLGQIQSGVARVTGSVVSKAASYAGATTDYDNVIVFTAAGDYTLPASSTAGGGWKVTIMNGSTISAPFQVRVLRSSTDTIDADAATVVYVLPGEAIEIRADGTSKYRTRGRTQKGRVVNVASYSDVGSTTASTTDANMQASNFSYQPISPNSLLEIQWSFEGEIANLASTNTNGIFTGYEVTSGNTALGAVYNIGAPSSAGGVGAQAPSIVLVNALPNTALAARLFALFARTNNSSASVSALVPRCEIREIHNA